MASIGETIRDIRKRRGIGIRQLSKLSGLGESHISKIERQYQNPTFESIRKLANALEVDINDLLGTTIRTKPSLMETARSLLHLAETSALYEIPLRGAIPAGTPFSEEEQVGEHILVPQGLIKDTKNPYALRVNGNSLSQNGIHAGDNVIVDPDAPFVPGKIYVVRIGNEVAAKRITDPTKLQNDIEILGRVIAYGSWNKC